MLDKATLGRRYRCFDCGTKFFDLKRPEAICPQCGINQKEGRKTDPKAAAMAKAPPESTPKAEEAETTEKAETTEETPESDAEEMEDDIALADALGNEDDEDKASEEEEA